ncbi:MAG: amidohydrolase/deacetylase family metallohydrolase [Acidobacteria bacterium]|nr:amidohydrolase/deacetylase family metallohydrolase [Acidobacteriota bacterium]
MKIRKNRGHVEASARDKSMSCGKQGGSFNGFRQRCIRTRGVLLLAVMLCSASPVRAQQIYDLVLKGGQVIDPKNQRNGRYDIAIVGNKIVRVGQNLPSSNARLVVDVSQYYVTPGLIDIHTHFDAQGAQLNLNPDHNALQSGVTTAVDAGSSGWKNFEEFQKKVISRSRTRLLAFLNIVGAGMYGEKVENDVQEMDVEAAARMVKKYPQTIVGIKTAHFQPATWEAVDRAMKAAELSSSVVMVDFHPKPGRGYPELILKHMRPGDIHTHFYGRLTPQLGAQKKIQPYMWEARKRGILFDVGHGSGSFWFRIAVPAIEQGFLPDTISTDIHKDSIMLPRATMTMTMSKFLNIGLSIEQVIERSTVNPANAIRRPELGTLSEGSVADIAVLELEKGSFAFLDSGHGKLIGDKRLRCVLTVREGKVAWDTEGLSLTEWSNAGPYSNFK